MSLTFTRAEAASILGMSPSAVSHAVRGGRLARSAGKHFTDADLAAFVRGPSPDASARYARAVARREWRLMCDRLASQAPATAVEADWAAATVHVREAVLAMVPPLVERLVRADQPSQVQAIIQAAVDDVLNEIVDGFPAFVESLPDSGRPAPSMPCARTAKQWREVTARAKVAMIEADERIADGIDMRLSDVEPVWLGRLANFKSRLLSMPAKLAPLASVEFDNTQINSLVLIETTTAIEELSFE